MRKILYLAMLEDFKNSYIWIQTRMTSEI